MSTGITFRLNYVQTSGTVDRRESVITVLAHRLGEPGLVSEEEREGIRVLLRGAPAGFEQRYAKFAALRAAFHQELSIALEPAFNEFAKQLPRDTIQDRNDLAVEVNGRLRTLGLTLKCPRTGKPAIIITDRHDPDRPEESRFRLQVQGEDGRRQRTVTSKELFSLDLMPDPGRVESFARGYRKPPDRGRTR